nr:MAG TPA: hypothetical protein [Bacteriophage sp.]
MLIPRSFLSSGIRFIIVTSFFPMYIILHVLGK